MYDNLLLLPLFQGLSKNNLTTIIEKVKFHFHTYEEGETIIRQGDDCRQLCFLMNGEVTAQITDPTHGFSITEVLEAPFNIELYSLYGMHTRYQATYTARTKVNLLTIDKDYIFQELSFEVEEEGTPYWVAPVSQFRIGLFGGEVVGRMAVLAEGGAANRDDIIVLAPLPLFNADGTIKG